MLSRARSFFRPVAAAALLLLSASCAEQKEPPPSPEAAAAPFRQGEVLARLRPVASAASASPLLQRFPVLETIDLPASSVSTAALSPAESRIYRLQLPAGTTVEEGVRELNGDPAVAYAEPNYLVRKAAAPDDPSFSWQWFFRNTGQTVAGDYGTVTGESGADIGAAAAWDLSTGGGVTVAVIDTGVDYLHPDLAQNIWTNAGETPGNGIDDDGNGYVDDIRGWNFVPPNGNNNPMDDDVDGHGTHVAGIIGAAGNNGIGVSGVTWSVRIMPLKFLDSAGGGAISDAVKAIAYATKMGAKVVNASYTYPQSCTRATPSQAEFDAIASAASSGVLLVAAAGNYGCNNDTTPFYPSSHPLPNIISVAATDQKDARASFSNYGKGTVLVGAPGTNIYSTIRTSLGSYGYMSGTSMASPVVAGLAALLMSYHPEYDYRQVREAIALSAAARGYPIITGGRVDAFGALTIDAAAVRPLQPTGVKATKGAENLPSLTWVDNSTVETACVVERRSGPSWSRAATLPADSTSWSDDGIRSPEGKIYYRLKAVNPVGDSAYSAEVSLSYAVNAPTELAVSSATGFSISLQWRDNSAVEDSLRVERKTGSAGSWKEIALLPTDSTAFTDTGLSPATDYYYRVRAYQADGGYSAYSAELPGRTETVEVHPPGSLAASPLDADSVFLSWADTSIGETGFLVERKTGVDGTYAQVAVLGADITSYLDGQLLRGTTYLYRVRSFHSILGTSAWSNEAVAVTPSGLPAPPQSLAASPLDGGTVFLSWTDASSNESSFAVERRTGADGSYAEIAVVGAGIASYMDSLLLPSTTYFYRVRAYRETFGYSAYSNETPATTLSGAPHPPESLAAVALSPGRVFLSWTDAASNETAYSVERKAEGEAEFAQVALLPAGSASFTDSGLLPETTYYYRVRAYRDSFGWSVYGNQAAAHTPPPVLPAPGKLATSRSGDTAVTVSWEPLEAAQKYLLERNTGNGPFVEIASVDSPAAVWRDETVDPGARYAYRVRAWNQADGYSAFSSGVEVRIPSGTGGGGCFIATAAYGSYLHPKVKVLRRFRDEVLMTSAAGRRFVSLYYSASPPVAGFLARHPVPRGVVRVLLAPLVWVAEQAEQ